MTGPGISRTRAHIRKNTGVLATRTWAGRQWTCLLKPPGRACHSTGMIRLGTEPTAMISSTVTQTVTAAGTVPQQARTMTAETRRYGLVVRHGAPKRTMLTPNHWRWRCFSCSGGTQLNTLPLLSVQASTERPRLQTSHASSRAKLTLSSAWLPKFISLGRGRWEERCTDLY